MPNLQDRMTEVFPQPLVRGLQAEIASLCKVKPASVSAWFNRPEKVSSISRSNAETLCTHYGLKVTPAWLAEGVGRKYATFEPTFVDGTSQAADAKNETISSRPAGTLDSLVAQLAQLDPVLRPAAGALLNTLVQQPDHPSALASLAALLEPATFAEKKKNVA